MDAICLVCESAFGVEGSTTTALQLECPNCQMGILMFDEDEATPSSNQLFEPIPDDAIDSEGAAILSAPFTPASSLIEVTPPSLETKPPLSRKVTAEDSIQLAETDPLFPGSEALHTPEDLTRTLPHMQALKSVSRTDQLLDALTAPTKELPRSKDAPDTLEATPAYSTQALEKSQKESASDTADNEVYHLSETNPDTLDLALGNLDAGNDDMLLTTLPVSEPEPAFDDTEEEEEAEVVLSTISSLSDEPELEAEPEEELELSTEPKPAEQEETTAPSQPEPVEVTTEPEPEPAVQEVASVSKAKPVDPALEALANQLDDALTSSLLSDPLFGELTPKQEPIKETTPEPEPEPEPVSAKEPEPEPVSAKESEPKSPSLATGPVEELPEVEDDVGEISMAEPLTAADLLMDDSPMFGGEEIAVETLTVSDMLSQDEASSKAEAKPVVGEAGETKEEAATTSTAPSVGETEPASEPVSAKTDEPDDDDMDLELATPVVASKEDLKAASGEFGAFSNISLEPQTDPNKQTLPFVSKETVMKFVEQQESKQEAAAEEEELPAPTPRSPSQEAKEIEEEELPVVAPPPPPQEAKEVVAEPVSGAPDTDPTGVLSEPPMVDFDAFSQEFFEAEVKETQEEHEAELLALLQQQQEESRRIIRRILLFTPILIVLVVGMFWSINYMMTRPQTSNTDNDNALASARRTTPAKRAPAPRKLAQLPKRELPTPPVAPPRAVGTTTPVDAGAPVVRRDDVPPTPRVDDRPAPRVDKRPVPRTDDDDDDDDDDKTDAQASDKPAPRVVKRRPVPPRIVKRRPAPRKRRVVRRKKKPKRRRVARRKRRKKAKPARRRTRVARASRKRKSKSDPVAARKHYQKGMRAFLGGNLRNAERELKKAVQANARLADAHRVLGMTYMRMQKNSKAKRHLKTFLRLAPSHPIAGMIRNVVKNLK